MLDLAEHILTSFTFFDGVKLFLGIYLLYLLYSFMIKPIFLVFYYRAQGVPFVYANPLEFTPQWLHDRKAEFSAKYSKYFMYPVGPFTIITLIDPEMIKDYIQRKEKHFLKFDPGKVVLKKLLGDGLATSEGELWKSERKILNKAFRHENLLNMISRLEEQGNTWVSKVQSQIDKSDRHSAEIDLDSLMYEFTLESLAACTLGGPPTSMKTKGKEIRLASLITRGFEVGIKYALLPTTILCPRKVTWNLDAKTREFNEITDLIKQMGLTVLTDRLEILRKDPSLLDTDLDLLNLIIKGQCEGKQLPEGFEKIDKGLLIDELATFFIAGVETTAISLTWLMYHLTKYPKVLKKMRAEVVEIFGQSFRKDPNNFITSEGLNKLNYMSRALKENLRVFPSAPRTQARMAQCDVKIGDLTIKKGTILSVEPYLIHHNQSLWEDPERFDPDRKEWTEDNLDLRWIPFSAGKRNCIGQFFSLMESKVFLCKTLLNFDVKCDLEAINRLKLGFTLRVEGGMKAVASRISQDQFFLDQGFLFYG